MEVTSQGNKILYIFKKKKKIKAYLLAVVQIQPVQKEVIWHALLQMDCEVELARLKELLSLRGKISFSTMPAFLPSSR